MINITIVGQQEVMARFSHMPEKLIAALNKKFHVITSDLRSYIITDKLSGQVLNHKTGALWRSINEAVSSTADSVVGRVFSSGDVKYAGIHEFGGVINHPGGTAYFPAKSGAIGFISNAKAATMKNVLRTRPHQIPMPERSFMRSSLKDKAESIKENIQQAVKEGTA